MRACIIAASALALAAPLPALAQDEASPAMAELSDRLSDPVEQEKLATMVGAMGEVLMELPVGPLVNAMAKAAPEGSGMAKPDIAPDATMRDLAGPGAERMQDEIADKVPVMMGMLAGLVEGLDALRPALKEMANRMENRIGQHDLP